MIFTPRGPGSGLGAVVAEEFVIPRRPAPPQRSRFTAEGAEVRRDPTGHGVRWNLHDRRLDHGWWLAGVALGPVEAVEAEWGPRLESRVVIPSPSRSPLSAR